MPQEYEEEKRAARRAGAVPVHVPSAEFDKLTFERVPMIYVVVEGRLVVSKRDAGGVHVTHAWLAGGIPVQAAGEFKIGWRQDTVGVTMLNNMSGHYRPAADSLKVARQAFESRGLPIMPRSQTVFAPQHAAAGALHLPRPISPESVRLYDWRPP